MNEVPLREFIEARLEQERMMRKALREYLDVRLAEGQRALEVATKKLEHDFSQVNELREQVTEERGMFPRVEVLEAAKDRIARIERLYPIISLLSGLFGALIGALIQRFILQP